MQKIVVEELFWASRQAHFLGPGEGQACLIKQVLDRQTVPWREKMNADSHRIADTWRSTKDLRETIMRLSVGVTITLLFDSTFWRIDRRKIKISGSEPTRLSCNGRQEIAGQDGNHFLIVRAELGAGLRSLGFAGTMGNQLQFAFLMSCVGGMVIHRAMRSDVSLMFISSYGGILVLRALWLGEPSSNPG